MKLSALKLVSMQAYLCAVMLVATVPLALLLAYQVLSGLQTQHQRALLELERTALLLATAIDNDGLSEGAPPDTAHWQRLLDRTRPEGGFIQLVDNTGKIVTSSGDAQALATAPSDLYSASRALSRSGWHVNVGLPAMLLDNVERRALLAAVATTTACLLLGLALATLAARRITAPLRELATAGLARAGTIRRAPPAPVQEVEWLRSALEEAHERQAQTQADLQRKATEFETLFASMPIGLAVMREGGKLMRNPAMDELLSTGRALWSNGQALRAEQHPLQRAMVSGQPIGPQELELRGPAAEGNAAASRHVLMQAVPLLDESGKPQGALASAVDITERSEAEQRMLRVDRQLQESQRLIDLAQEAGEIGFFRVDAAAASWTPGLASLFGFLTSPEADDYPLAIGELLDRIHADDREGVEQRLRTMLAAGRERSTLEFRVARPDGGSSWLSCRVLMSFDHEGRPLQLVGAVLNVDEQKGIELERMSLAALEQRARIDAEEANRAKDEFIAMLGHELRNPLGVISSAAEVLNQLASRVNVDAQVDAELATSARIIIARQTSHLARLVDDLLDVGRVISGKVLLHRQRFDLAALVQRVVDNFRLTDSLSRHDVQVQAEPVWVDADSTRIEQVINNLLGNAIKYTPPGRRVDLKLQARQGLAILEVRDTGNGISPVFLPHIFDLFVQGERSIDRSAGGLGIGLTLVRRLVEMHGGEVAAESSPAGSTFTVRLPALPAQSAHAGGASEGGNGKLPPPEQRPARVLVVEDNADARDTLRTLLELDGHSVVTAEDGLEGLSLLLGDCPDVAIVDIGLPGLSGFEIAKRGRRAGYAGQLLALSGYSGDSDVANALRNGFDAHLSKPVDAVRLRQLLSSGITARELA